MEQAEDLLKRLDSQHNDILKKIDDLDQLITNVLLDWCTPVGTGETDDTTSDFK